MHDTCPDTGTVVMSGNSSTGSAIQSYELIVGRFAGHAGFELVTSSSRGIERLDLSSTITRRAPSSSGMPRGWPSLVEA